MFEWLPDLLNKLLSGSLKIIGINFEKGSSFINIDSKKYQINFPENLDPEELEKPEIEEKLKKEVERQISAEKDKIEALPVDRKAQKVTDILESSISSVSTFTVPPSKSPPPNSYYDSSIYGEGANVTTTINPNDSQRGNGWGNNGETI